MYPVHTYMYNVYAYAYQNAYLSFFTEGRSKKGGTKVHTCNKATSN